MPLRSFKTEYILSIYEAKIGDTFPEIQFIVEGHSIPCWHKGGIHLYVWDNIPSMTIKYD